MLNTKIGDIGKYKTREERGDDQNTDTEVKTEEPSPQEVDE